MFTYRRRHFLFQPTLAAESRNHAIMQPTGSVSDIEPWLAVVGQVKLDLNNNKVKIGAAGQTW